MYQEIKSITILIIIFNIIFYIFNYQNFIDNIYIYLLVSISVFLISIISKVFRKKILEYWLYVGKLLSKVFNPIFLSILYFIIISPYSIILKSIKKNFFSYDIDRKSKSYWINKNKNDNFESLKDQF